MDLQITEVPIQGMDCADCTRHVQRAIASLPGVESVEVYLTSEKAVIQHQPGSLDYSAIRKAVSSAGYTITREAQATTTPADYAKPILSLLAVLFGVVLFIVVIGEGFGLIETLTSNIPWWLGLVIVILIGYPAFYSVIHATLQGHIIAHSLMSIGVLAAIVVGQWGTAAVVAFFMRVGDFVEKFTTERARTALKDLSALAPQTARLFQNNSETEVPIQQVEVGQIVIVRPGEQIPVDGVVVAGHATVDQATITGESMPIEAGPGTHVFAATLASLGSLRVRATHIGSESTYGKVIKLVEEAEAHRGNIQRLADRFSTYYLPFVLLVALLTFIIRRDPLATAAVLVVACSCAFALATPIAVLASVGAAAKQGILIKGGKYLERLPAADTLLIDKTGTLTLGKPQITDILPFKPGSIAPEIFSANSSKTLNPETTLLALAASAERYSEHPLAEAVLQAASQRGIALEELDEFEALPGMGIKARLNGSTIAVGNQNLIEEFTNQPLNPEQIANLNSQGKTLLYIALDSNPVGVLAATDTLRPEVPEAIHAARSMGLKHVELLTGDNQLSTVALANELGIPYRAELLPEDKITIVKKYQSRGHTVIMVGDGVNDAPALAQSDVGIAMGAAGRNIAMEAAHIILMREDWDLVPKVLTIAHRTSRVIKGNIGFTMIYNFLGLTLAALGYLPPIFAAAAQSLPDLAILANSSRLLRQK